MKGRSRLEETLKEMVAILRALREGQEVTNAKLDGMEQRLSRVEGEVTGIKVSVDFLVHKG